MSIRDLENKLFDDWSSSYIAPFVMDGLVNEECWNAVNRKILFVLKEANAGNRFDLRHELNKGGRQETWQVLSEWAYGLLHLEENLSFREVVEVFGKIDRKDILRNLCIVNINKEPGGSVSKNRKLKETFHEKDRKYLSMQLSLYEGVEIIICCGSVITPLFVTLFEDLYGYKYQPGQGHKFGGVWTYQIKNGPLLVSFYHPQQRRYSKELLYNKLLNAVKEGLKLNYAPIH